MRISNRSGRGRLEAIIANIRHGFRQSFPSSRKRLARSWWVIFANDCCPATIRKGSGVTFQTVLNHTIERLYKDAANGYASSKPGRPNEQRGCEITRARVGCGKSSRRIVWLSVEQEIGHQRAKVKRSDNRAVTLSDEHGKPRGLLCLRSLAPPVRKVLSNQ